MFVRKSKYDGYKLLSGEIINNQAQEILLLESRVRNLECQLREAKRRDNRGRFVSNKETENYFEPLDDFLTRS